MSSADPDQNATPVNPGQGQQAAKAARVVPAPTLRFTSEPVDGLALRLEHDDGTLGRRGDNPYVVAAPQVSRVHAQIERRAGSIVITDLGSSGGTKVNGEKITGSHVVNHGDTIEFGGVSCRLEDPATAAMGEQQTMVMEVPEVDLGPSLSPRQQEVIELIAEGMTNAEIGDQLGISERTVKAYAQELYDKLGVRNRAGAVAEAVKHGLL
ncbi:MAG: LuxR C-terminal-related transcriptional regulator [Nitriliruptorales bacterium]|nr:LuxR C-terminal-related transcriptional regulator [Nitriliruptorales bacterium]